MLKYCMQILTKVSFDPLLFSKELKKAFQWISREEKVILNRWLRLKFKKNPKDILGAEVEENLEKSS
jgi:hypothetical protein